MDISQIQPLVTAIGVFIGLLVAVLTLLTGIINYRKAKYEALKAGVPQGERGRVHTASSQHFQLPTG